MHKENDKNKYKNVISINDIRKKKGLPPVSCDVSNVANERETKNTLDERIEILDSEYEDYIISTKNISDEKKKIASFKKFLGEFNKFFDYIYDKETKHMLKASPLKEEINYAMKGSGKRLRPFLMYLTYKAFGGDETEELINFMIAIELIHSFSLVHDDMPCMDNDELRRGKESVWKKFGEAKALLAGDAMLSMAQEIAGYALLDSVINQKRYGDAIQSDFDENGEVCFYEEDVDELRYNTYETFVYATCVEMLAVATGVQGMIAGQAEEIDLQNKKDLKVEEIVSMYSYKTGALLSTSLSIGYELSLTEEDLISEVDNIGWILGSMYQIKDDLEDVLFTTKELGKPTHSDEKNNKHTYIALNGIDGSKADLEFMKNLIDEKFNVLEEKNVETAALRDFVFFVLNKRG